MNLDKFSFYNQAGMGNDASKYLDMSSSSLPPPQTAQAVPAQPKQEDIISFDDPRFVDDLVASGSPEAAERTWGELTGANRVLSEVDREILAMKAANPRLPAGMFTSIAESRKAELRAQAPGLGALEEAKRRLTDVAITMKSNYDKFSPELQALVGQEVASGKPFTKAVSDRLPDHLKELSGKAAKGEADPLRDPVGGGVGKSGGDSGNPESLLADVDTFVSDARKLSNLRANFEQRPEDYQNFVRLVTEEYNKAGGAPTGDTPEAQAAAEEAKLSKERAKKGIDLAKRAGGIVIESESDLLPGVQEAMKRGRPFILMSPDGSAQVDSVSSDEDLARIVRQYKFAKDAAAEKSKEVSKEPDTGFWTSARRMVLGSNLEELEQARAKEAKGLGSEDVLVRAKAAEEISKLDADIERRKKTDSKNSILKEYGALERRVEELKSLAQSTRLGDEAKREVREELSKSESALKQMQQLEEIKSVVAKEKEAQGPVALFNTPPRRAHGF
jgi:hypothetical protein